MFDQIIGGALKLGQGLFGTGTSQQQSSTSQMDFRPEDIQAIRNQQLALQGGTGNLLQQLQQSQQAVQQGYQPITRDFAFSASPDALTRGLAALGTQQLAQQAGAQQKQIAQQFRGDPNASRVLQAQAAIQQRLASNPLLFNAMQMQQGRELQAAGQNLTQQQAANQAVLNREQALSGLAQTGVGAQQNLLATLLGLGQAFGKQQTTTTMTGRSGGLFS